MAVRISPDPTDCDLQIAARPTLGTPVIQGTDMTFDGTPVRFTGFATLLGDAGDSAVGWDVGFIQAQWVETNWCSYRGPANHDGSVFIQRGRAPARTQRACRDCVDASPVSKVFYSTVPADGEIASGAATDTFPLVQTVAHFDKPGDSCPLTVTNTLTGKVNQLREAQFEFLFCVLLSVRNPAGNFRHLMGAYWNTRWQYTFDQPGFRPRINASNTGATVAAPFRGDPNDRRFESVLTSATETKSCNAIFRAAKSAFNAGATNRHESRVWADFPVTAP